MNQADKRHSWDGLAYCALIGFLANSTIDGWAASDAHPGALYLIRAALITTAAIIVFVRVTIALNESWLPR
jgi:hypothetical protein